ncbi:MAG: Smr/MutS family protein [Sphingomonadaceae bacterium]
MSQPRHTRHPRGLTQQEAEAWERLAATVTPLPGRKAARASIPAKDSIAGKSVGKSVGASPSSPPARPVKALPVSAAHAKAGTKAGTRGTAPDNFQGGLDSHWDRRIKSGGLSPDFTLDLHGASLDAAHQRLDQGLMQAKAMGARIVLLVTGRPRPVAAADRGNRRGAIRANILDWLAAGPHGSDIAAIRGAHRNHGGPGALYLILRQGR